MELLQLNFKFSSRFLGAKKEKKANFLILDAYWMLSTDNAITAQSISFYLQTAQPLPSHPLTRLLIAPTLTGFKNLVRTLQRPRVAAASRGSTRQNPRQLRAGIKVSGAPGLCGRWPWITNQGEGGSLHNKRR